MGTAAPIGLALALPLAARAACATESEDAGLAAGGGRREHRGHARDEVDETRHSVISLDGATAARGA
ncbi:hypothetical protein [Sphingomonas yunnanensis]|uniref:hypothetical protein n=1 Tax=Sphingomonas yunnanensis TaxID=310400 RepID=UPI001CA70799|nr:hypothetical protein [Sphingomonas yunnanensis]